MARGILLHGEPLPGWLCQCPGRTLWYRGAGPHGAPALEGRVGPYLPSGSNGRGATVDHASMEARMAAVNAPDYTPKPNQANQDGLLLTACKTEAVISDLDEKVLVALSRSFCRPPAANT